MTEIMMMRDSGLTGTAACSLVTQTSTTVPVPGRTPRPAPRSSAASSPGLPPGQSHRYSMVTITVHPRYRDRTHWARPAIRVLQDSPSTRRAPPPDGARDLKDPSHPGRSGAPGFVRVAAVAPSFSGQPPAGRPRAALRRQEVTLSAPRRRRGRARSGSCCRPGPAAKSPPRAQPRPSSAGTRRDF